MATGGDYPFQPQPTVEVPNARSVNNQLPPEQPLMVESACQKELQGCGGYECEFVLPPPKAFEIDCSICLQVLRHPHLISCCGHNFCQACIDRVKADGNKCPLCKSATFTLMHNKGLERSLKELEVRCTYTKVGCQWTGELGTLNRHLNINPESDKQLLGCGFVILECYHGCGQLFRRKLLANHQEEGCPKRPYSCDYCRDYASTFDDVANNHWPECKCYPLSCPNHCTPYAFERQDLEHHVSDDCPLTVVNCDLHYAGCDVQLPRKDMPAHIKENVTHLSLLSHLNLKLSEKLLKKDKDIEELRHELKEMSTKLNSLTEAQKRLDTFVEQELDEFRSEAKEQLKAALRRELGRAEEAEQMNATLRREIGRVEEAQRGDIANLWDEMIELTDNQEQDRRELRRQATGLCHLHKHGVAPVEIVMPDFERHRAAADQWLSDPFYTHPGGYKMCLSVYANGNNAGKGTHVSVYAYLMQGEFDHHLKWPLVCIITIQLTNQVEDEEHHEVTLRFGDRDHRGAHRVIEGELATVGWGRSLFVSHTSLYNHTVSPKYLDNDCIRLRVVKFAQKN